MAPTLMRHHWGVTAALTVCDRPPLLRSSGTRMHVVLRTDSSVTATGFDAQYRIGECRRGRAAPARAAPACQTQPVAAVELEFDL